MKWFAVQRVLQLNKTIYEMYELHSGSIFLRHESHHAGDEFTQSFDYYKEFEKDLVAICISIKDFDEPMSYNKYITPLFRNKKLDELGI